MRVEMTCLQEEAMGLARGAAKIKSSIQKWDELVKVASRRDLSRVGMPLSFVGTGTAFLSNLFLTLVQNLVRLASLQTSFVALDEAIKVTNRRVNALDNVRQPFLQFCPAFRNLVDWILRCRWLFLARRTPSSTSRRS